MRNASIKKFRTILSGAFAFVLLGASCRAADAALTSSFNDSQYFSQPLFSFAYGGKPSASLLAKWDRQDSSTRIDDMRTERRVIWTDPATGLQVRWMGVLYHDFQAVEWTVYLKNTGRQNTPIIQDLLGANFTFRRSSEGEFVLHGTKGDWCAPDSFAPFDDVLRANVTRHFAPYAGRPTNAAFPYYNLQMPGGGVFLAIGWPGQWASSFVRDSDLGLTITAGQELTHLFLKPGEQIRTPLTAVLYWKGSDTVAAQNVWRRWMIEHNLPRTADGKLPSAQILACSSHQFKEMTQANEENQKLFVDRYLEEGMKIDYWWMDAGWYPCGGQWVMTGTWEPDLSRFPNGIRAVSDHAHARRVGTILWFEPERVGDPNSWLGRNHPEWLLSQRTEIAPAPEGGHFGSAPGSLLNLGNPEALHWLIDHVDRLLTEQGIDFYRQDFNTEPLWFWRKADSPDRQGITENLYVQGYLAYWDALRERHPALRIDTCASGGRRNDLETLRRAVPLLRSDYLFEPTSQQDIHLMYATWIPYDGGGYAVGPSAIGAKLETKVNSYAFRSNMGPSLTLCFDMRKTDIDYDLARTLVGQLRQMDPDYFGDFYPLTPYSLADDVWMAWQYDRPAAHKGFVQAFRRPAAAADSRRFILRGLEPSGRYVLTDLDRPGEPRTVSGSQLLRDGLLVVLPERPGAAIVTYRKSE